MHTRVRDLHNVSVGLPAVLVLYTGCLRSSVLRPPGLRCFLSSLFARPALPSLPSFLALPVLPSLLPALCKSSTCVHSFEFASFYLAISAGILKHVTFAHLDKQTPTIFQSFLKTNSLFWRFSFQHFFCVYFARVTAFSELFRTQTKKKGSHFLRR